MAYYALIGKFSSDFIPNFLMTTTSWFNLEITHSQKIRLAEKKPPKKGALKWNTQATRTYLRFDLVLRNFFISQAPAAKP
ncbi:MAG: hypothetical protein ABIR06_09185 [Cyclobacteriaceae bacterium]